MTNPESIYQYAIMIGMEEVLNIYISVRNLNCLYTLVSYAYLFSISAFVCFYGMAD